jgi:hypothetical protein
MAYEEDSTGFEDYDESVFDGEKSPLDEEDEEDD